MTEMTERDELFCYISDTYKDLYGVRPRHIDPSAYSTEELRTMLKGLEEDLRAELERERAEDEAHRIEVDYQDPADADEYPTSGEGWSFTPAEG